MKRIEDFIVKGHRWLNYKNYLIDLESEQELPPILPGNFAELAIPDSQAIFLRRPFSVFDVDHARNLITFYIKVVGKGTQILGESKIGDRVNLIYPLGNAFSGRRPPRHLPSKQTMILPLAMACSRLGGSTT